MEKKNWQFSASCKLRKITGIILTVCVVLSAFSSVCLLANAEGEATTQKAMYYEVGVKGEADVVSSSSSSYYGRMIFRFGGISNTDKHYVLSFDMKTEKGGVPWKFRWNAVKGNQDKNNDLEPARVEGNRYFFYLDVNSTTAAGSDGILLFTMFMAEKSAGYVSNFELYETDSNYVKTGNKNLADTYGDFTNWNKGNYTTKGDGYLELTDLMKNDSGRVEDVASDYFDKKDAKMMYYKATSAGEGRVIFRFPSDSSSTSNFCYKLSFDLKTTVGTAPTKFWGQDGTKATAELVSVVGTKYTFNVKVPKISNGYANVFSMFFPAGSEGYISNIEMYRCDANFENVKSYNYAAAYGDFSVWTKEAQSDIKYVGSLQLAQNMDSKTGTVEAMPKYFFENRAMYYEVGVKGGTGVYNQNESNGRMFLQWDNVSKGKKYVLSFDMKATVGSVPYAIRYSLDGNSKNYLLEPYSVDGHHYEYRIDTTGVNQTSNFILYYFFAPKSAGYLSNFEMYETDSDYNKVEGASNLADTYGDFMDWKKSDYQTGEGTVGADRLMKTITGENEPVSKDLFTTSAPKALRYSVDTTNGSNNGRIIFRWADDSSSTTDRYYLVKVTVKGSAPKAIWGHDGYDASVQMTVGETTSKGTEYIAKVKARNTSHAHRTSILLSAGSKGYITNFEVYRSVDSTFSSVNYEYNYGAVYGDFSTYSADTQSNTSYVGSLQVYTDTTDNGAYNNTSVSIVDIDDICPDVHDYTHCKKPGNVNKLNEYRECEKCGEKIYINNINGDADNVIDIRDLVALYKYIENAESVNVKAFMADLNDDNEIDSSDVAVLRSRLLGIFA